MNIEQEGGWIKNLLDTKDPLIEYIVNNKAKKMNNTELTKDILLLIRKNILLEDNN